jgi:trimeric autotransporter adhesin
MKTHIRSILITLAFLWPAVIKPNAGAVVPPPDGGYPGANTAEGQNALLSLTTGTFNAAIGWQSLRTIATANFNTGVGAGTLALNHADQNTATGAGALFLNTSGTQNTANGAFALLHNDIGSFNTATGNAALFSNTAGLGNTATGFDALAANTTGGFNTANGNGALLNNNTGSNNTATGTGALGANTTGDNNTASGFQALFSNTGSNNTAIGIQTLHNNTSGSDNLALGADAGVSLTTGDHNIDIANPGVAGESGTIRIGNNTHTSQAFIAGISGVTVPGGVAVIIDANGHLGTNVSSARFKDEIKPMDNASEAILALKPVTFRYKKEFDSNGIPQFGLVAEDVAKVNPDLVARDAKGELYTVRYEAVNAMLLNEFLKEHQTVQQQGTTIAELKKEIANLTGRVKEQETQLQRVSVQVGVIRSVSQSLANDR